MVKSICNAVVEIPANQQFRRATDRYAYQCYGLSIRADRILPELLGVTSNEEEREVEIVEGVINLEMPATNQMAYRPVSPEVVVIQWPKVGALRAERGRFLTYQMEPDADPLVFRMFIYCQGLGVLLQQRGLLVLHASCVRFGQRTIAFAGTSGDGKSTLAAMCCEHGAEMLADDVLAVSAEANTAPRAWPGFARLKLRPEISSRLTFAQGGGRPIGEYGKSLHATNGRPPTACSNLDRVYFLSEGSSVKIEVPGVREALPLLIQHSYGRALIPYLKLEAKHLTQCGALMRAQIVRRLRRPRDLELLRDTIEVLRRDLE